MNNFGTTVVKAADSGEGLDNPSFQLNQPFKPLTPAEKKLVAKKMQKFRNWLSKQKKDIDPLDIPLKRNQNSIASSSVKEEGEISIPVRRQENAYYCGPASAQEVLDYNWYGPWWVYFSSKYSQKELADDMHFSNATYYVYLRNELNNKQKDASFLWISTQVAAGETDAANEVYTYTKGDISSNEGLIFLVNTYPKYGYDVWGERYGLIGYYNPQGREGHSTGHYVVGYGYTQYNNGKHFVKYVDSNYGTYDRHYGKYWGIPLGKHEIDARNMGTCVIGKDDRNYIIW